MVNRAVMGNSVVRKKSGKGYGPAPLCECVEKTLLQKLRARNRFDCLVRLAREKEFAEEGVVVRVERGVQYGPPCNEGTFRGGSTMRDLLTRRSCGKRGKLNWISCFFVRNKIRFIL